MGMSCRILVLTGDGKGKTTSALGIALRAWGQGLPVRVIQFLKRDDTVGEYRALAKLGIPVSQHGRGFVPSPQSADYAAHAQAALDGLSAVEAALREMDTGVLVLDEICGAVAKGLIPVARVTALLDSAASGLCVVLTGRGAPPELVDRADTVTEMRCVRHGLQAGIAAQRGVEF